VVKWHLKTQQGIKNLPAADAVRLAGEDPDYAQRDLFDAIARGDFPRWNVFIQVMTKPRPWPGRSAPAGTPST